MSVVKNQGGFGGNFFDIFGLKSVRTGFSKNNCTEYLVVIVDRDIHYANKPDNMKIIFLVGISSTIYQTGFWMLINFNEFLTFFRRFVKKT
jgi:hypothetical protein